MRARFLVLVVLICAATTLSQALGHPSHGPAIGERYAKIDLRGGSSRLVYGLTYTANHGLKVRQQADANGDGRIDERERSEHADRFLDKVRRDLRLLIDGEAATLSWGAPFLGPAQKVAPGPLAVEVAASYEVGPGEHRIVLEDGAEFEGIYRTGVAVAPAPEVELLTAGRGSNPLDLERRIVFLDLPSPGAPPKRIATAVIRVPGAPPDEGSPAAPWPIIIALGAALLVALFVVAVLRLRGARGATGSRRGSSEQ